MTVTSRPAWTVEAVLLDGSVVRLRPLKPADEPELLKLYERLDERSRAFRFFTGGVDVPRSVHRLAEVDRERFGLLATRASDGEVVGHGEYVLIGDGLAEVALAVSPEFQGQGVGTEFLVHLAEAADEDGVSRFRAEVLPTNHRRVDVAEDSGFPVVERKKPGTIVLEMSTALWPAAMGRFEAGASTPANVGLPRCAIGKTAV